MILFNSLLDVAGGPRGINYHGRYRPRTTGGVGVRGDMVMVEALGDTLRPGLSRIHRKIEKKRWKRSDGGGKDGGGHQHPLTSTSRKSFFILS